MVETTTAEAACRAISSTRNSFAAQAMKAASACRAESRPCDASVKVMSDLFGYGDASNIKQ